MIEEVPSLTSGVDMKHLREKNRTRKHRIASCRRGRHDFSEQQNIGAGIARRVCAACSAVSIDLTQADHPESPTVQPRSIISAPTRQGT